MGWYFNPPPNWPPPPPGWAPPPGWLPDPSWGPAPPGHVFWIEVPDPPSSSAGTEISEASRSVGGGATGGLGSGIALSALILAAASLLTCWVPIVNNLVFFAAVLALLMGIAAVTLTYSENTTSRTISFVSIAVAILAIAGVLISQAFYSSLLT